eukprot:2441343-Prymnesium_polylepis.1
MAPFSPPRSPHKRDKAHRTAQALAWSYLQTPYTVTLRIGSVLSSAYRGAPLTASCFGTRRKPRWTAK